MGFLGKGHQIGPFLLFPLFYLSLIFPLFFSFVRAYLQSFYGNFSTSYLQQYRVLGHLDTDSGAWLCRELLTDVIKGAVRG